MRSHPDLAPRDPARLQRAMAATAAAHAFAGLPIGYWQRRLAARAFALQLLPAHPRDTQALAIARFAGQPPITVLRSAVMTWGWVPWVWDGDTRLAVREARHAVRRVLASATTPHAGVVFIVHARWPAVQLLPRLRMAPVTADATAVGLVTIGELIALLDEAATDLDATTGGPAADAAARQLRALAGEAPAGPDDRRG